MAESSPPTDFDGACRSVTSPPDPDDPFTREAMWDVFLVLGLAYPDQELAIDGKTVALWHAFLSGFPAARVHETAALWAMVEPKFPCLAYFLTSVRS